MCENLGTKASVGKLHQISRFFSVIANDGKNDSSVTIEYSLVWNPILWQICEITSIFCAWFEKLLLHRISNKCNQCLCVFHSFHRKGFSWLNKIINNVRPEFRSAIVCCEIFLYQGLRVVSRTARIQSYSGPHFSHIFPHWDWIRRDTNYLSVFSPNAGKCKKNADQNNSKYGHFLRSGTFVSRRIIA